VSFLTPYKPFFQIAETATAALKTEKTTSAKQQKPDNQLLKNKNAST
jgi:hypothetical protein